MIHIVSHTHWDREWYLTYEQFRLRLVGLVDRLLDLLESRDDFAYFHLDGQTIVLEDYLELRPEQEPRLRKLIAAGRILIGPWYDMPDEFLVSGESLIRNLQRGHRISKDFGTPMPVGYLPDLFGHVSQMPQILRNFGLDNAILWRGFGGRKAEYWWDAPDGSRVLMMHLPPEGYCNATRVHLTNHDAMIERASTAVRNESARTAVGEVLLMNGVDHVEPHPIIPRMVKDLAAALGLPVRHSTLPAYVDAVRSAVNSNGIGASLEVIKGELRGGEDYANLLPGVFSARTYIKKANARVQTLLEKRAEPLATLASLLGARYPANELDYAWKTLLQNHPHDSICGCSVDAVHEENMTRFARAEQVGQAIANDAAAVIARAVPAGPDGAVRLVAINTSGTPFQGVIEAVIDLPYADAEPRRVDPEALDAPVKLWTATDRITGVTTPDGQAVPCQILDQEDVVAFIMSRYDTPWGVKATRTRLLIQGDVSPLGYASFDARIGSANSRPDHVKMSVTDRAAANGIVRMNINADGTIDITAVASGTRYERCAAIEDVGDVGDEYNYSPPQHDRRMTNADARDVRVTLVHDGPLRAEFRIDYTLDLPLATTADRQSRSSKAAPAAISVFATLDAGSPRVGLRVSIDNPSKDHRVRMMFPVGAAAIDEVRAETAFGVVSRAATKERPAHVQMEVPVSYGPTGWFTEAGDDHAGAIVFGEGLVEYEAYTDDGPPRLALTLLRSVGFLSRDDLTMRPSGHAGPGLATPGAQCLGHHEFRLGFEPRTSRPLASALFGRAASFAAPPMVTPALGAGGSQSPRAAMIEVGGDAVLSACYVDRDTNAIMVRVFNPDDRDGETRLSLPYLSKASRVDFLGTKKGDLAVKDGAIALTVRAHGIETVAVKTLRP